MLPAGPEPPEPAALHAPSSLSFPRSWCCRDLLALAGVLTKLRVPELFLESSPSTKRRRFSSWPAVTSMKQTLTRNSCRLCEEHRELPSSHPQFSPYFSGLRRNIFRSYNFRLWTRLFLKTFTDGLTNVLKLVMHHCAVSIKNCQFVHLNQAWQRWHPTAGVRQSPRLRPLWTRPTMAGTSGSPLAGLCCWCLSG